MKTKEIIALDTEAMSQEERARHYEELSYIHSNEYDQFHKATAAAALMKMKRMQRQYPDEFRLILGWLTEEEARELGYSNLAEAVKEAEGKTRAARSSMAKRLNLNFGARPEKTLEECAEIAQEQDEHMRKVAALAETFGR